MIKQPYVTNPGGGLRAGVADRFDEEQQFESHIESRSKDLCKLVTGLAQSPFPSLRSDGVSADEELEALLVKEARLRWLVRVAKYSEGANREVLWLEAEKVLVDLEKTAEEVLHAECV